MSKLPSQLDKEILELCKQGKQINAIKLYKETTGKGLKESKDYVDKLATSYGIRTTTNDGGGSCFVATACYGDYNSLEVLILRHYRDEKLLTTYGGRLFVKLYYAFSPAIAAQLAKSAQLKQIVRTYLLKPIVKRISRHDLGDGV